MWLYNFNATEIRTMKYFNAIKYQQLAAVSHLWAQYYTQIYRPGQSPTYFFIRAMKHQEAAALYSKQARRLMDIEAD
jgi:hypothetical protein